MGLWTGMRSSWPDQITAWNREGIAWRGLSAVELLWMFHAQNFESLRRNAKTKVRRYLLGTGDLDRLRAWDAGAFSEGEVTPDD